MPIKTPKKPTKGVPKTALKVASKKRTLVLLDAHAIIHRAYHALPDFVSSKGEPTGALYGVSAMLMKILADFQPDYIVACYDLPQKTFRHEAYDAYKGTRKKVDNALIAQLESSRNIFKAFGIPEYDKPGFEADDMLGTIVEQTKDIADLNVIIASGDMDALQLVETNRVAVFTLKKGMNDTILYDAKAVLNRFGFKPPLLPDYKGLRGDPSDNIIGIAGIGEKTATTLISTFGPLEQMYKKLKKNEKPFQEAGLTPRIINLLKEGEEEAIFSKTLATIRRDAPIKFVLPPIWKESRDNEKIAKLFADLEFKSLSERYNKLFNQEAAEQAAAAREDESEVDPLLLEQAKIALWLLDSNKTNPSLEDIYLYVNGAAARATTLAEAYACLESEIKKNDLKYVFEKIELPLIPVIATMHENGILIDKDCLADLSKKYHHDLSAWEKKIWQKAGQEFNINSPKQLGEILFETLKLPIKGLKKSDGGQRSTRASELEKLKGTHPIIEEILNYRELQKLLSTYIDTLPELVDVDGRVRTQYVQTGTTTGRFSSINPNLQNIPIRSELGRNIRKAFIAEEGYKLVSFDYSQIELRIAAMLSGDTDLAEAFIKEQDIHTQVAARVFKVAMSDVNPEMRRRAKIINFGIIYGMGVSALKENLGTDRAEAEEFYKAYFEAFPSIAGYLESVKVFARGHGYTETLFGRRRYFPAIASKIPFLRATAERMAINAPIQGTEADIIKLSMIAINDYIKKQKLESKVRLLLQVHDELVFEIADNLVEEMLPRLTSLMENIVPPEFLKKAALIVPIATSSEAGKSWGDLK